MKYGQIQEQLSEKQILERVVRERTTQYTDRNSPQYNQELMEAHLKLAVIYGEEGNIKQAHSHYEDAEYEFSNMCKAKIKQPKYSMGGKEELKKLREQKKDTERRLKKYQSRLFETANEIGYDLTSLMFIPTSGNPKRNLEDLI